MRLEPGTFFATPRISSSLGVSIMSFTTGKTTYVTTPFLAMVIGYIDEFDTPWGIRMVDWVIVLIEKDLFFVDIDRFKTHFQEIYLCELSC